MLAQWLLLEVPVNKTVLLRDHKRRTALAPHLQKFPKCLSNFLSIFFVHFLFGGGGAGAGAGAGARGRGQEGGVGWGEGVPTLPMHCGIGPPHCGQTHKVKT